MNNRRQKQNFRKETEEEVEEYKMQSKSKKSSITKEDIQRSGVRLTEKQTSLYKGIRNNIFTIVHGPAGTSKTFTSCYTALALLADKKVDKIIITKPVQESGEILGALPGTLADKIEPYKQSYLTTFYKILGKRSIDFMFDTGEIEFCPLAYMRGSTYDNCVMMLDECQNASMKQLMLWATRISGDNSRAIMMGDTSQYDVRKRDSGYIDFIKMTENMENLFTLQFDNEDIVRHKFLIELTNRYDKYRSENDF